MTNYKILINSKGVPKLVEVPAVCIGKCSCKVSWYCSDSFDKILADESKHVAFKDEKSVCLIVGESMGWAFFPQYYIGQTFDLPPNIGVSIDEVCDMDRHQCGDECYECPFNAVKLATLTPKENSAHSFTEPSELKPPERHYAVLEDVSKGAEEMAKKIIAQIRKGSYEDWVKVISENIEQSMKQERDRAIQECIEVLNEHHDTLPLAKSESDNGYSIAFANAVNILKNLKK